MADSLHSNADTLLTAGACVFYQNIDFLTVRLSEDVSTIRTCNGIVENSDSLTLDHGFRVQFFGYVFKNQLKVLHILDSHANVVAFLHIRQPWATNTRRVFTDIEFVGLFWVEYSDYFLYFCDLFHIDRTKPLLVSRIDYCVDLLGVSVENILARSIKNRERNFSVSIEDTPTYRNIKNERHDLCVYDKKLDVLDKQKCKIRLSWDNPFSRYIDSTESIVRIEYRKKARAIRELTENSIDDLFRLMPQMLTDYFARYYDIDLAHVIRQSASFNRQPRPVRLDVNFERIRMQKASYSWAMAIAHLRNYQIVKGEKNMLLSLLDQYPHLSKVAIAERWPIPIESITH